MKPVVGRECFSQESKYFCSIFFRHCYSPTSMYTLDIKYYTWFLLPISRSRQKLPLLHWFPCGITKKTAMSGVAVECSMDWGNFSHKTMDEDSGQRFLELPVCIITGIINWANEKDDIIQLRFQDFWKLPCGQAVSAREKWVCSRTVSTRVSSICQQHQNIDS